MTRMVEPQAKIDRMSEEEATTDRHDMREIERGAKTAEVRTGWQGPHCADRSKDAKTTLESATSNPCSGSSTNPKMGRIFI